MVLENHMKLWQSQIFWKIIFAPKIGKMDQKWAKTYWKILYIFNFYWICSVTKIYIICCVPTQISYLGKFCFLRYGPKCPQPIRLQDILINHIYRTNQWNSLIFLHVDANSHKLIWQKIFWVGVVRDGCGQSGQGTLKLTVSQEWIDEMNWFFA